MYPTFRSTMVLWKKIKILIEYCTTVSMSIVSLWKDPQWMSQWAFPERDWGSSMTDGSYRSSSPSIELCSKFTKLGMLKWDRKAHSLSVVPSFISPFIGWFPPVSSTSSSISFIPEELMPLRRLQAPTWAPAAACFPTLLSSVFFFPWPWSSSLT